MASVKRIIISTLIIMGVVCIFSNSSFAAQNGKAKEALKLRKTAEEKTTILEIIPEGDEFEILESDNEEYYKVKYNKIKGYVKAEYVEMIDTNKEESDNKTTSNLTESETTTNKETEEQPQTSEGKNENEETNVNTETSETTPTESEGNSVAENKVATIKSNSKLYVRPLISSKVIEVLEKQQEVFVVEMLNKWAYVDINGKNAWVLLTNLEIKEDNTKETTSRGGIQRSMDKIANVTHVEVSKQNENVRKYKKCR